MVKRTDIGRLRLHTEPAREEPGDDDVASWQTAASLFAAATGWSFEPCETVAVASESSGSDSVPETQRWRLVRSVPDDNEAPGRPTAGAAPPESVAQLARQLIGYHEELESTYRALREREAELATAVPLSVIDDEGRHLSERLAWVLKSVAEAIGCDAAALYLLDDTTQTLKLRSSWGIPRQRLAEPPRSLRGAVADLEALMGSAVVLEDVRLAPFWRAPEGFAAALCLPVASDTTPLGTLWLFSRLPRTFGDADVQLAEVGSGRIVADLERETLRHEVRRNRHYGRQMHDGFVWQQDRLPHIELPIEGWSLAGWRNPASWVGGSFFDWMMLPDGRALLAAGDVEGTGVVGALGGATLRGMVWSHASIARTPIDLLERVHESWWLASPGGQHASVMVAVLDPESGDFDVAAAGTWRWLVGGKKAVWETICQPQLGESIEADWLPRPAQRLKRGHRFVLATATSIAPELCASAEESLEAPHHADAWVEAFRSQVKGQAPPSTDQMVLALTRGGRKARPKSS